MPTPESQILRNEWYNPFPFCSPKHNMFHVEHCSLCAKALLLQFEREAQYVQEIYRLEREAEKLL